MLEVEGLRHRPAPARSSFSTCTPARSSGSSACAAPGITPSAAPCSGDLERAPAASSLGGRELTIRLPAEAVAPGIGFVSGKRGEESLAADLAVRENLFLNPAAGGRAASAARRPRRAAPSAGAALAASACGRREPEQPIATLSGGNQQKVVLGPLARGASARLLILEEPTFGVDVGAKAEIYRLLAAAPWSAGRAVLLISSDFEEVAGVCHRALVFNRGRIVTAVGGADALGRRA